MEDICESCGYEKSYWRHRQNCRAFKALDSCENCGTSESVSFYDKAEVDLCKSCAAALAAKATR